MDMMRFAHADLNLGVDGEVEQERLNAEAGRKFRQYRIARQDPRQAPAAVEKARDAYIRAQALSQRANQGR